MVPHNVRMNMKRRELLCDFIEISVMWCICGTLLIAVKLRILWGWIGELVG